MEELAGRTETLDLAPQLAEKKIRRATGPRSVTGKASSSQNARTHGCRSQTLILPGESQDEFDNLYHRWMDAYCPEDPAETEMVEQIVISKWFCQRNQQRYAQVELQFAQLGYTNWDAEHHKQLQLALRYKTAAERSVTRSINELEAFRKNRSREKEELRSRAREYAKHIERREHAFRERLKEAETRGIDVAEHKSDLEEFATQKELTYALVFDLRKAKTPAETLFQGQLHPSKVRRFPVLEQWVDITTEHGKTITTLEPSNENLIREGQAMDPPPEAVFRHFHFESGVPEEYHWAVDDPVTRECGGFATQRMTVDTWLVVIDREKLRSDGHVGRTGVGNLPKPLFEQIDSENA